MMPRLDINNEIIQCDNMEVKFLQLSSFFFCLNTTAQYAKTHKQVKCNLKAEPSNWIREFKVGQRQLSPIIFVIDMKNSLHI